MIAWMKRFARTLSMLAALVVTATPAWAALPEAPGEITSAGKPYAAYAVAVVLMLLLAVVSFKPSKRSHLD